MGLGERIKHLREKRNLTQKDFAEILKIGRSTVSQYESNSRAPDNETLKLIAEYFCTSTDYLLGRTNIEDAEFYRPNKVSEIKTNYNTTPLGRTVKIPLLGIIPAGKPLFAEDNIIDYIDTPIERVSNGEYFYLQVQGNSMINARIHDGDQVLIYKQSDVENGEIAAVRLNGYDATLKRVKKMDNNIVLYPENSEYDPIFVKEGEDIEIIGKVVEVRFEPKRK